MGYISVIGLGVIGTPLAHLLYRKFSSRFVLLADDAHAEQLQKKNLYVNKEKFEPEIFTESRLPDGSISIVFICVKNYDLAFTMKGIAKLISDKTILVPLQNGVFAKEYLEKEFPDNIVLEGFAQGPNTLRLPNGFVYQNAGVYHLGTSAPANREVAHEVHDMLLSCGLKCFYHDDIRHFIYKKMMLNVAANASTALTGIDYCMIKNSTEMQCLCRRIMQEFQVVVSRKNVLITEEDINDVMNYFMTYMESKKTSMLEDVLNKRRTENEFLAGYIVNIAHAEKIDVPYIEALYLLVKIKEDVYLTNI